MTFRTEYEKLRERLEQDPVIQQLNDLSLLEIADIARLDPMVRQTAQRLVQSQELELQVLVSVETVCNYDRKTAKQKVQEYCDRTSLNWSSFHEAFLAGYVLL